MMLGWEEPENKALNTFRRIREALDQNQGYRVMYEVSTEKAAEEVLKFINKKGYQGCISVRVRNP